MAAIGCTAAPEAAKQLATAPSLWPARRARQTAARVAEAGRLAAALRRVEQLEAELLGLRSAVRAMQLDAERAAVPPYPPAAAAAPWAAPPVGKLHKEELRAGPSGASEADLDAEVTERLAVMAPVVKAVLTETREDSLTVRRRNAAGHCRSAPARAIRRMGKASLNRLRRGDNRPSRTSRGPCGWMRRQSQLRGPPPVVATADAEPDVLPEQQPHGSELEESGEPRGGMLDAAHGAAASDADFYAAVEMQRWTWSRTSSSSKPFVRLRGRIDDRHADGVRDGGRSAPSPFAFARGSAREGGSSSSSSDRARTRGRYRRGRRM